MENTPRQHDERRLVELDDRRRLALGKLARPEDKLFFATVEDDGTIVLAPAVAVLAKEVR